MSIQSAICAEAAVSVVRKAVAKALAKAKTEEAKRLLKEVLDACEEGISE